MPFYGEQVPAGRGREDQGAAACSTTRGPTNASTPAWPAYEAALKANKVPYQVHYLRGTQHGFNNDTTPRYDANAAKLAWQRTVEFFNKHLRSASSR